MTRFSDTDARAFRTALALLALLPLPLSCSRSSHSDISVGKVERGELLQKVTIAGVVSPNKHTLISAPYAAYVRKLYVQIGDVVKTGAPVVSLTQSLTGSHEPIYPMRAPFDGRVVQVLRTEGEYVDPQTAAGNGTGLVRIDDLTHVFVEASSPEVEVDKLKVGQDVLIKASSILSRSYKGVIRHVSLAAKEQKDWDKSRVEFDVWIEVEDSDPQLKSGMSVICDIVTHKLENVLTLKQEFVQKTGDKYFVTTESGAKKPIEVGLQNEESFEIRKGLVEGEKVRQTDFLSLPESTGT